jgi:hypothetical protein
MRHGYVLAKHMRASSEMHYAPQMIMTLENEKNFIAREYLKVATLRATSRPLFATLPVSGRYLLNFGFSIPITGAYRLGEHCLKVCIYRLGFLRERGHMTALFAH